VRQTTHSDPETVISCCLWFGGASLLAGVLYTAGWYRWMCVANAALFFIGAWAVSRRLRSARWIVAAACLPPIIVAIARPTPRSWTSWVGFALLLYLGWLALKLPTTTEYQNTEAIEAS
jgi:hypothetical protein